ncbi:CRISPR system precrRNA processing endoribonuclease RAMP protein Cas6 [Dehalococcoidia bacterium]|nr:CRISPR system precrRNA processing endoribonuclease RAMP protein Cas6 [Dehalococcoidia bacterium]
MSIYFAKFRFSLKLLENVSLPAYLGSTLRGGFGHVFKRTVCISRDRNCMDCLLIGKCVYSYCFETPTGQETALSYTSSNHPHPFIIEPPHESQSWPRQNDHINFNVVLIGNGIDYLPYFVFVFDELGRSGLGRERGKYLLEKVEALSDFTNTQYETIYDSCRKFLSNGYQVRRFADIAEETSGYTRRRLAIRFVTPTRIKYQGRIEVEVNFSVLIKNLLRRISLLSEMHCNSRLDLDYADLIEKARNVRIVKSNLHWYDWERYSSRQKAKMKLGGFVGDITFEGDLAEFMPFIKLGEYLHVGKGTSFGLGEYVISQR